MVTHGTALLLIADQVLLAAEPDVEALLPGRRPFDFERVFIPSSSGSGSRFSCGALSQGFCFDPYSISERPILTPVNIFSSALCS
jgi:hypothetical protein